MSESATQATPIEPVNATSTSTNPVEKPARSTTDPRESRFEDVISQINQKYGGDPNEFKSLGEITQKVENEAKPKANSVKTQVGDADDGKLQRRGSNNPEKTGLHEDSQPEITQKPPQKEKLKVGEEEFELDQEQLKRFAQKGIFYDKKGIDISKKERQIQEWQAQKTQDDKHKQEFFTSLGENPGQVLEGIFGPQIFEKMKPWAAQKVQKEMEYEQNPQLAAIDRERQGREAAEARAAQYEQQIRQQQVTEQASQLEQQYSQTIMQALQEQGIPRTDFTAAEMASHMDRAASRNMQYTPQQLAQIVREDNATRIKSMTDAYVSQINEARKSNDLDTIVNTGGKIVEMFGEPLMYAVAKYHLAKLQKGQPQQPKTILDTPKTQAQPERKGWGKNGRQYMSEDEFADMRRKIARGEMDPPAGW